MSSAGASVYITDDFSEPMSAQHNFINNFDLDHPEKAMSAYQKYVLLQKFFLKTISYNHQDHARAHQAPAQDCYQLSPQANWHDQCYRI